MVPLDDNLPTQPTPLGEFPRRPAQLTNWPEPIHHALDDLVAKAAEAGEPTNRSQLAAALILEAKMELSADELVAVLGRYANAQIRYVESDDPETEQSS